MDPNSVSTGCCESFKKIVCCLGGLSNESVEEEIPLGHTNNDGYERSQSLPDILVTSNKIHQSIFDTISNL